MPLPKDPSKHAEWKQNISNKVKEFYTNENLYNDVTYKKEYEPFLSDPESLTIDFLQLLINTNKTHIPPTNIKKKRGNRTGFKHTQSPRKKMSESSRKTHSYEHVSRVVESRIGGFWYGNVRYKECVRVPVTIKKIRVIRKPGAPVSQETRRKISESKKGKPHSEEHKRKLSEANKGKTLSKERCIKLSESHKGLTPSEETRTKQCETMIGGFWYGNVRYNDKPQYCEKWTSSLKERVRAYRGYVCFECGKTQEENGKKLDVHHVHYNKKTCCDGSPSDLVPLCRDCHLKTNFNRKYWEERFTKTIYSLDPNGKCFFTKDEIVQTNTTETINTF